MCISTCERGDEALDKRRGEMNSREQVQRDKIAP